MSTESARFAVAIIGGGPAGTSCAIWLSLQGISCVLIEREATPMPLLRQLDLLQNWVPGEPETSTAELAQRYARHLAISPGVTVHCQTQVREFLTPLAQEKTLVLGDGRQIQVAALVFATGLRPRHPSAYFGQTGRPDALDAITLTRARSQWCNQRVLLLGGGDNSVENAIYLAQRGNRVVVLTRGTLRASAALKAQLLGMPTIECRLNATLPSVVADMNAAQQWVVQTPEHGTETFDQLCVLFGFEAEDACWQHMRQSCGLTSPCPVPLDMAQASVLNAAGVFVAGDASNRLHPCISSALADGIHVAKQVANWLDDHTKAIDMTPPTSDQRLEITGLRFVANLGILDTEKTAPQPIQVDAELNLGRQPLLPHDDDICHVLDYRKVRKIIIDECTAEHVNLLETLIGKLAHRLLQLPHVRGVRVKIAKLEIFEDCEVAIRMEAGQWQPENLL